MMPTTKDVTHNLTAVDVMTSPVVAVGPTVGVREVASLMLTRRISGIPVVSEHGQLLGIVTECDLLHREARAAEPEAASAAEKATAVTVREIMTAPVITVADDTPVRDIAELMLRTQINRVPVVRDGRLVGIVSRADVLRGLVRPDEAVATAVRQVLRDGVRIDLSHLRFWVRNGVVSLEGVLESRCERELARRAVEAIDGVIEIDDRITCRIGG
jgi:CBS domain-containing protein